jgi:hypothetical protein
MKYRLLSFEYYEKKLEFRRVQRIMLFLIKHYSMKIFGGSREITLHNLNLDTRWRTRIVNFKPQRFYPRAKNPSVPIALIGPRASLESCGEKKSLLPHWESNIKL